MSGISGANGFGGSSDQNSYVTQGQLNSYLDNWYAKKQPLQQQQSKPNQEIYSASYGQQTQQQPQQTQQAYQPMSQWQRPTYGYGQGMMGGYGGYGGGYGSPFGMGYGSPFGGYGMGYGQPYGMGYGGGFSTPFSGWYGGQGQPMFNSTYMDAKPIPVFGGQQTQTMPRPPE